MIVWEKRRGREFVVSACTGRAGDSYYQQAPGHITEGLVLPPVGSLVRATYIWSVVQGAVQVRRQDGVEFVMDPSKPSAPIQVRSLYQFTLLSDDSRIVCVAPVDPSIWWQRQRYVLTAGERQGITTETGPQRLLSLRGSFTIDGKAIEDQTVVTLSPERDYELVAGSEGVDLYLLTHGGAYTLEPPADSPVTYGDGLYV